MGGHAYGFEVWGKGGQWGALAVGFEGPIRRMLPKQNNKHNMKPVARYQAANGRHRTRGQSSKNAGGREGREEDKSLGRPLDCLVEWGHHVEIHCMGPTLFSEPQRRAWPDV
jgi:hypothetical protein